MTRIARPIHHFPMWLIPAIIAGMIVTGTAAPTSALRIAGDEVVVPVIAHNPGLFGTEWRTDVWIDNPYSNSSTVTLTFFPENKAAVVTETTIEGYRGVFFGDIVLETFGMDDTKGMLVVSAPDTLLEVRARIYNTGGGEGDFGQALFGIPTSDLSRQGYISGVSTLAGNRVSVGIANPTDDSVEVRVSVRDTSDGSQLYAQYLTLAPHQLVQISDVAARWGLPESAMVTLIISTPLNEHPFYAYASVVRNDTGDASFLFGTSPNA